MLAVSASTVERLVEKGTLTCLTIHKGNHRYLESEVLALITEAVVRARDQNAKGHEDDDDEE